MLVMALGLSYKTAPLALLERAVFPREALAPALAALGEQVAHAVILSTCNRVELYGLVGHYDTGRRALLLYLRAQSPQGRPDRDAGDGPGS